MVTNPQPIENKGMAGAKARMLMIIQGIIHDCQNLTEKTVTYAFNCLRKGLDWTVGCRRGSLGKLGPGANQSSSRSLNGVFYCAVPYSLLQSAPATRCHHPLAPSSERRGVRALAPLLFQGGVGVVAQSSSRDITPPHPTRVAHTSCCMGWVRSIW